MENENLITNTKDLPQSYDNLVWIQLVRCSFLGSQDTTNAGAVSIQDEAGKTRDIIRYNYVSAFIHSVETLYYLVKLKHKTLNNLEFENEVTNFSNSAYQLAKGHFKTILEFINKSGLFGYQSIVEIYGENGTTKESYKFDTVREIENK